MKKTVVSLILAAVLIAGVLTVLHLRQKTEEAERYAVPALSMVLTEENAGELERYTALESVDFQNSTCYDRMERYVREHPQVHVTYRVDLGGTVLTNQDPAAVLGAGSFSYDALLENLRYLPELRSIALPRTELTAEQLDALRSAYPELDVTWTVPFQAGELEWNLTELTLENADAGEADRLLDYLPLLRDVTFSGTVPGREEILSLKERHQEIRFHWNFSLLGIPVSSDDVEIDLSGIPMESVEELERSLPCFNCLEKVVMCDTGLESSEIDELWKRHPEIRFVWNVRVGRFTVRTDVIYLMPNQHGYYGTDDYGKLRDEDCTEMKYLVDLICLDMGHMNVSDISFVRYMPKLEYLIVADTHVTDLSPLAGAPKLKYLEAFFNKITDISPLAQCHALEDVNICHNWIKDFSALLELENLKHIWIAGHSISQEDRERLEAAHPEAVIVYYLEGSTGAGWRELPNYYAQRDIMGAPYMPATK